MSTPFNPIIGMRFFFVSTKRVVLDFANRKPVPAVTAMAGTSRKAPE